jgi:hypothetical protein
MRTLSTAAGIFVIAAFFAVPAFAQRGHQPTTPPTTHATAPTNTTTTHGNSHATRPTTTTSTTTQSGSSRHSQPRTTTSTTTTPTTTTTNPIATRISRNPQLATRLTRMLPDGMTLATASSGFRNQGQFIAALHVSQNQGIKFTDLKDAMTGPSAMSLGQAIHTLRPSANADDAVRRANHQAQADLR